eukprot:g2467.t1
MSTSSAESDSRFRAHYDYVLRLAKEVGKELELEYAQKIPEYNKQRKSLLGYRMPYPAPETFRTTDVYNREKAFKAFFDEYMRRVQASFISERSAAVEGSFPLNIPEELLAEIADQYVGTVEIPCDGVLGMLPALVLGIPHEIVKSLHKKQGDELELSLEAEIMALVQDWVETEVRKARGEVLAAAARHSRDADHDFGSSVYILKREIETKFKEAFYLLFSCRQAWHMYREEEVGVVGRAEDRWKMMNDYVSCNISDYGYKAENLLWGRLNALGFRLGFYSSEEVGRGVQISWM